jgi:hypothetical protein
MNGQHPDPERLALAALPAEPRDPEIEAHLPGCTECRGHLTALRRTVELARTGHADSAAPPPRVWQAILDELNEPAAEPAAEPATGAGPLPSPRVAVLQAPAARQPRRWRSLAVPIAAAAAGLAIGMGVGFGLAPTDSAPAPAPAPPPTTLLAQLQPIGPADPGATGTVDGLNAPDARELVIHVSGVTDTEGGDYLEAWLIDPLGTRLVSLGALTRSADGGYEGAFSVPADLPMATFNTVDVSVERWDGDPSHSRNSLLRGSMT